MKANVRRIKVNGFQSIGQPIEVELKNVNILIGDNGAGKSNFLDVFLFLKTALFRVNNWRFRTDLLLRKEETTLAHYGYDPVEHDKDYMTGGIITPSIDIEVDFGEDVGYKLLTRAITASGITHYVMDIQNEAVRTKTQWTEKDLPNTDVVQSLVKKWKSLCISNTSVLMGNAQIDAEMVMNGGNLPSTLFRLKTNHPISYETVVDAIKIVFPSFVDFSFDQESKETVWGGGVITESISFQWIESNGETDYTMRLEQLSHSTLRFVCLVTAILDPITSLLVLDEPELGLNPYAISVLAELIQSESTNKQFVIATQSPNLLDHFEPEDVVLVDRPRETQSSIYRRLDKDPLLNLLPEHSLSDLWERGILHLPV